MSLVRATQDGYPMMANYEVEYIRSFIILNGVRTVLEWGSGNSTIWFPKHCPKLVKWVSIEHNGHYVEYLKNKVASNVELRYIQDSKEKYINGANGEKYDLILVDGEYRKECVEKGFTLLNDHPTCRVLLHDSGRKEYEAWYTKYKPFIAYQGQTPTKDGGYAHRGLAVFNKTTP